LRKLIVLDQEITQCLRVYRSAISIYDEVLDDYPETEIAVRIASEGHMTVQQIDNLLETLERMQNSQLGEKLEVAPEQRPVSKDVLLVQREMKRRGYDLGPVDGIFGDNTREAIKSYQRDNGLAVDGRIPEGPLSLFKTPSTLDEQRNRSFDDILSVLADERNAGKSELEAEQTELASIREHDRLSGMIRRQISPCWSPPPGARDADTLQVSLQLHIDTQGNVSRVSIIDETRMAVDRYFRSAAEAARRAVLKCAPLELPADKYEIWKQIKFNFDPSKMLS